MPIRINLLSEVLAEEDLRRRDPVKRAIYAGAFLVALSLVYWSSIWLGYVVENQKLSSVEAGIQACTNDFALVKANLKKIDDIQAQMKALDQLSAARFLQGNLLNALQQTYVPNVQLTHLKVDQTYATTPGVPAKPGVSPGRPASSTEHVTFTMDARDFSPNPGDQVQHFKDALLKQDYFDGYMGTNGIRLAGLSPLQSPPEGKPYVMFSLECRFADRTP
ncbi:MAG: hypothetical protein ABSH48_24055 [Verrucomicrobiota bacterium]|jgi:hypothetical protein